MLSLANLSSASAATHYYEKDDYYAKDDPEHKGSSEWYGKGAAKLKLKGEVEKEDFKQVLEGDLPNGAQLGRKQDGKLVHAPGMDLTFSAPKSVSIMAEVKGDKRIYEAQRKAVLKTLDYIEKNLVQTRKMVNGNIVYEKVDNISVAIFRHNTSRKLDPQVHTHCVLANAIERKDGNWRSAFFGKIFDNKLFLGQIYRSTLAYELKQLGYEIRITGRDSMFELKEIPDSLIKTFSTRANDIAKAGEQFDSLDAKLKAKLALRTRNHKDEVSKEILHEMWQEKLNTHDLFYQNLKYNSDQLTFLTHFRKTKDSILSYAESKWQSFCEKFDISVLNKIRHISEEFANINKSIENRALDYAIKHLSERQSVWKESELMKIALSYTTGVSNLDKLEHVVNKAKENGKLLIAKVALDGFKDGEVILTTKQVLEKEISTINLMKEGQGKINSILSPSGVNEYLKNTNLNEGQIKAVQLIITTQDRAVGVQGYAGVGKTYMLSHVKTLAEQAGYKVIGMAPSCAAAYNLQKEAGIASQTIHKFLFKYNGLIHGRGTEEGKLKMRTEVEKTILIVDESSLASTNQMNALFVIAKELNLRVAFVGDIKQLNGVELGKPFYQQLRAGMKTVLMGEIIRQKDNHILKAAVYDSINGEINAAMSKINGNIIESKIELDNKENEQDCLANVAANEWLSLNSEDRKTTLIVAPSHKLRESMNLEIRKRLKFEGELKGESIKVSTLKSADFTLAQMSHAPNYKKNFTVLFNRGYISLGIKQGEYLNVRDIKGNIIILQKENGALVNWLPDKMGGNRKGAIEVFEPNLIDLQAGDLIKWTKNSKNNPNIINSHIAKVQNINNKKITVKLETGKIEELALNDVNLKHIDYSYVLTVHAAQGKTFKNVIGVLESSHPHLTNQKLFYVTISRAKSKAMLITDDKEKLTEALYNNKGERTSAIEHQGINHKTLLYKEPQDISKNIKTSMFLKNHIPSIPANFNNYTIKEIYQSLYNKLPQVLPEFGFRQHSSHYVSTTEIKSDGSLGKRGKVYVYANNPGILVDYTKGSTSIWNYVKERYLPGASKAEIMKYLTDMAGLGNQKINDVGRKISSPILKNLAHVSSSSSVDVSTVQQIDKKLLSDITQFAKNSLFKSPNEVLKYIKSERGYNDESIKSIGLGYIKSKQELGQYLKNLKWSGEKIKEAYKLLHYIGKTHQMVLPYYNEKGEIIGLVGRNINYKDTDKIGKYLYTKGLSRSGTLLNIHNLKNNQEAIIVEGMLDCLHANAKGMNNIVALGGTAFNLRQLKLLESKGVNLITLCLDNDKAGKEAANKIKGLIMNSGIDFKLKEAMLPNNIKDPDQLIKEKGIDALRQVISSAKLLKLENNISSNMETHYHSNNNLASNSIKNNVIFSNSKNKFKDLELEK